ncbi:hypothetical protein AC578_8757 [Pseudocercospora eumusae]|uniref:Uncharacterized protein n=1 Tax=Pseudocercospora eumusae TaxID=321146 RepID=A0A139H6B3_9PEZI|nr:hypothetical protein AC578_8757 [Pseudocercospora eumusae]
MDVIETCLPHRHTLRLKFWGMAVDFQFRDGPGVPPGNMTMDPSSFMEPMYNRVIKCPRATPQDVKYCEEYAAERSGVQTTLGLRRHPCNWTNGQIIAARMRLIGRGNGSGTTEDAAHIILQLGDSKIQFKAAQLRSVNSSSGISATSTPDTEGDQNEDERKAIEALSRMQEALSPAPATPGTPATATATATCTFSPWSPDDLYPYQSQPNLSLSNASHQTLHHLRREPSDANLPAYYDAADHPYYYYVAQQTSASAVCDMALHKGAPTIFHNNNFAQAPTPRPHPNSTEMRQHELAHRSTKSTRATSPRTSRRLDLVHIFPQQRQSGAARMLSPSRHQHSPSAMTHRSDFPLPPLPTDPPAFRTSQSTSARPSTSGAGTARKKQRPFDEDILDQHKTNVRRPPKGIQNWFDAYLSSDDDDEDGDDVADQVPHELPADDVLPPAYSGPGRLISHASEKSPSGLRGHQRINSDLKSIEHDIARAQFHRKTSSSDSGTSNSIQSSHQGNRRRDKYESRMASSTLAGESVLSLSESDYDDEEDDDEKNHLPPIRDSIMYMDSGHITIANASSIDVVRLQRPTRLSSVRHMPAMESKRSSSNSSVPTPIAGKRDGPLPGAPHMVNATATDSAALRRLNALSYESAGTLSSGTSFQDAGDSVYNEHAHMMAVSEEEKMLLDLMRRKRAAMQQISFTEGYQLALQTEQDRLAKHSASAEQRALKALKKKGSRHSDRDTVPVTTSPTMPNESDMRRQFSVIRKEHVDERFQIERFLGMSQPQPLSSHPPDSSSPAERPHVRAPSGELLPSTTFSPTTYSSASHPATSNTEENSGYCSADDCETESARIRVRQFISTNGAVPPLNSMKTMRRPSNRQPTSIPPSPIAEENAPPLPQRSPDRPKTRDFSFDEAITRKISSLSTPEDTQDWGASPVSPYTSPSAEIVDDVHVQPVRRVSRETILVPPRADSSSVPPEALSRPHPTPAPARISFSPFSNIINAAAAPKSAVHRVDSAQEPREQHVAFMSGGNGSKPTLPRLNTFDSVLNQRASMLSITSAGEEVLGAWADLGGGRDCLRTKRKSPKDLPTQ